jgi:hypothetical protein
MRFVSLDGLIDQKVKLGRRLDTTKPISIVQKTLLFGSRYGRARKPKQAVPEVRPFGKSRAVIGALECEIILADGPIPWVRGRRKSESTVLHPLTPTIIPPSISAR